MRINVDKLLSEGWRLTLLGKTKVLIPPKDSELLQKAARLAETTYKGELIGYFKYSDFNWDSYKE
jgi:hypothetical protein